MFIRLFIIALNFPVVATAIFSCAYSIWFAKYQQRNVGPSVTYMAYALIALIIALSANFVFWVVLRKRASELRFLRRIACAIVIFFVASAWIGDRFSYVGERYALTHSLWSAIRMKDPPMFAPYTPAASGQPVTTESAPEASPCQKSCK